MSRLDPHRYTIDLYRKTVLTLYRHHVRSEHIHIVNGFLFQYLQKSLDIYLSSVNIHTSTTQRRNRHDKPTNTQRNHRIRGKKAARHHGHHPHHILSSIRQTKKNETLISSLTTLRKYKKRHTIYANYLVPSP